MRRITAASDAAQDLGIGVRGPRREIVLAVQAHADAVLRRGRSGPRAGCAAACAIFSICSSVVLLRTE